MALHVLREVPVAHAQSNKYCLALDEDKKFPCVEGSAVVDSGCDETNKHGEYLLVAVRRSVDNGRDGGDEGQEVGSTNGNFMYFLCRYSR